MFGPKWRKNIQGLEGKRGRKRFDRDVTFRIIGRKKKGAKRVVSVSEKIRELPTLEKILGGKTSTRAAFSEICGGICPSQADLQGFKARDSGGGEKRT